MPDDRLAEAVARWRDDHGDRLTGPDDRTASGLPVAPLYTPLDVADGPDEHLTQRGLPGEYPFTRGIRPGMYREGLWVMGQYSGRASPAETNLRIRSLLAGGQQGFSIALDLPTQNGLDSDHPLSAGEVGKVGVPIDTLRDVEDLLDGIPLDQVSQIRTTANAIGPIAVALLVAGAEAHGYRPSDFKVMLQNDVLKEYLARGTYIFPPRRALEFTVDVIEYCARELPHWEPIEFCGYHIRDAGGSAVHELAIAFANGIEYLDAALRRGLRLEDFAHNVYLFLAAHIDLLEEVAKFRTARRMWARLMRDRYRVTDERACAANIFVYTLGSLQTAQEPLNNIVRIAYQALAAALGGVQTLATSSYDEALQLPGEQAVRVALRTQQILAHETGVTRTADPLGGSYAVEAMTDRLEQAVAAELDRIRDRGGALAALESGWLRDTLDDEAYRQQMEIEERRRTVVGVNRFTTDQPPAFGEFGGGPGGDTEAEQRERLAKVKRDRSPGAVADSLAEVAAAARRGDNTIPSILVAVREYATVGEICAALASVWGRASTR
ncbi:methylmalonyl-CoA mutase family protein [Dactylosporangium sp. NPDC000555]|uniref:acyl-CoA mutase large subunit family protein n=1 Tax=Dactylosporangium sp. NPDC000555 TaxID=3154260 RepID=UPI0033169AC3